MDRRSKMKSLCCGMAHLFHTLPAPVFHELPELLERDAISAVGRHVVGHLRRLLDTPCPAPVGASAGPFPPYESSGGNPTAPSG